MKDEVEKFDFIKFKTFMFLIFLPGEGSVDGATHRRLPSDGEGNSGTESFTCFDYYN